MIITSSSFTQNIGGNYGGAFIFEELLSSEKVAISSRLLSS